MTDCDYCSDESFDSEKSYLKHLKKQHYEDLSSIDQRKVDAEFGAESDRDWTPIIGAVAIIAIVGAFLWFGFTSSNSADPTDGNIKPTLGAGHNHISIQVSVNGQDIDFSQKQYQLADQHIHFEGGDGETLHLHATSVTLEYALEQIPNFGDVTSKSAAFDGTTFSEESGDKVKFVVNGKTVDATSHVLKDGQSVKIVLQTAE